MSDKERIALNISSWVCGSINAVERMGKPGLIQMMFFLVPEPAFAIARSASAPSERLMRSIVL